MDYYSINKNLRQLELEVDIYEEFVNGFRKRYARLYSELNSLEKEWNEIEKLLKEKANAATSNH